MFETCNCNATKHDRKHMDDLLFWRVDGSRHLNMPLLNVNLGHLEHVLNLHLNMPLLNEPGAP